MQAEDIIRALHLQPLPEEGGYFCQTYLSRDPVPIQALPGRYAGTFRPLSSAIYYLLTNERDSFSALHGLKTDEIYHFYLGDAVQLLMLHPDGGAEKVVLGTDILHGQKPQLVVPAHCWQGARLVEGGKFALLGTTMAPAFDWSDFTLAKREELLRMYPQAREEILRLTRS